MTTMTADVGTDEAQAEVAARSVLYRELASALRFPSDKSHHAVLSGELRTVLGDCVSLLPYAFEDADRLVAGIATGEQDYDLFQSEYVGLFDVGAGGPPCPLYGGAWGGDRQKVMEETLRFYRFFGLTISSEQRELPDQLSTELEFLHFLTFRELEALEDGTDTGSLRRASRDFLGRHPARWLTKADAKLGSLDAGAPWCALIGFAAAYCRADAAHLVATEGPMKD